MRLKDKVGIVTGGAGGIGRGIALAMAKEGAHIAIVDINEENGEKVLEDINGHTEGMLFIKDISKRENVEEIVEKVVEKFGRLDILVNNAHASKQAPFAETTMDMFDLSFNTGFYPTFNFMQVAYPELKRQKVKSLTLLQALELTDNRHKLHTLQQKKRFAELRDVAANEWGADEINVNLISPIALTEGVKQWSENFPELYDETINKIPMKRMGDPEKDIGRIAVFLASEDSDYITGQTIMSDGGSTKL